MTAIMFACFECYHEFFCWAVKVHMARQCCTRRKTTTRWLYWKRSTFMNWMSANVSLHRMRWHINCSLNILILFC